MIQDFFQPLNKGTIKPNIEEGTIGNRLYKNTSNEEPENGIVIFSIGHNFPEIRFALSNLTDQFSETDCWDLGVFKSTDSESNNQAGLSELLLQLNERKCVAIIIDSGVLSAASQWNATKQVLTNLDFCIISPGWNSPLNQLFFDILKIKKERKSCFHFSTIAHQAYYNNSEHVEKINDLFYENLGLGDFRADFSISETLLRESAFASFDLKAIRNLGWGKLFTNPNGLYPEEACVLFRQAGIANTVQSIAITNIKQEEISATEAELIAQMIWYAAEGYDNRINDHPDEKNNQFMCIRCPLEKMPVDEIVFLRSLRSGRLWISVGNGKLQQWLGCSEEDLEIAQKGEVPEKWYKSLNYF